MLTKSNYLLGLQCSKLLWITKNCKEKVPELSETTNAIMKEGEVVGEFARFLYPDGVDLSNEEFDLNIIKTKKLLEKRVPLFEAGFLVDDLYSRVDILVPVGDDEWEIVEVKSATSVKDVNIHDVSFQKYVYEKVGLNIKSCAILHLNNQYIRNGEIELIELFYKEDVTEKVEEFSLGIEKRIEDMVRIINSKEEPGILIGAYCDKPYECSLKAQCWQDVPGNSVFDFNGIRKKKAFELYDSGIKLMKEVSDDVKLNEKQKIQRLVAKSGEKYIDKEKVKSFLDGLNYPIYYLDFETVQFSIPRFNKSKSYTQIPFQYSLHIQENPDGELKHVSFLAKGAEDSREMFLQSLKENLGDAGDILVYNHSFEISRIRECVVAFMDFGEWAEENILPRIKDLADVFRGFWYYDLRQKGSASIKAVLKLFSDLKYNDLDISKGDVASLEFKRVTYRDVSEEERFRVRENLEKYCELDTLAEVEIIKGLRKIFE